MSRRERNYASRYHTLRALPVTHEILSCPKCGGFAWRLYRAGADKHAIVYECQDEICGTRYRRVHLAEAWIEERS